MTDRERWTVYPLLFLTLGIVIKDKLSNLVNVDRVFCKSLVVTDRNGRDQVLIRSTANGGIVEAHGIVQSRGMYVFDQEGKEQAAVVATPAGGLLKTHNNALNCGIDVGSYDVLCGLIVHDSKGRVVPPILQFQPPVAQPKKDAEQPAESKPAETEPATSPDTPQAAPDAAAPPQQESPEPPSEGEGATAPPSH